MEKIETHEDLIDLGAVSVETKGLNSFNRDGPLGQTKDIVPGMIFED